MGSSHDELPTAEKEGTPAASLNFEHVYSTYVVQVARWVRVMGAPPADRNDLVQEVFVVVHRRLKHLAGQSLGAYIYRITQRKVRDHRRLRWVRSVVAGKNAELLSTVDSGRLPPEQLEAKERGKLLERLLRKLNDRERAALLLFELDGLPGAKIAELQGVPINTVWARIRSARLKLQQGLNRLESRSTKGKQQ